jgi:hypothetical protein
MRKKLFVALVCGLMVVPFIMGTATAKTLKIGSMSPLTGPYASDGTDIKNGVLTAIQVFEEAGGIPGYDKIELLPQDTACDPKQAVAAANKLINLEVVGCRCLLLVFHHSGLRDPGRRRHPHADPGLHQRKSHRPRPALHVPPVRP